jgi:DNA helicase-2/ATP-dependent DNA helicase PcrA
VFAELVDRRLASWGEKRGGLAALSFTNVARAEIEDRVSAATVAPHFIGTLDAFFLRFVVGPFGHLAGLPKSGARLIPSPLDQQLTVPAVVLSPKVRPSIFQIVATAGTESSPQFQVRRSNGAPAMPVPTSRAQEVLQLKKKEWATRGRVTHGDCSYLAACILLGAHGAAVRRVLTKRFPIICIDEFQDTGHFLGRAVLALLAEKGIEAVAVGDVDQKIFGFSGVSPTLFEDVASLEGAQKYPLQISQRCAKRICEVASALSRSESKVVPCSTAPVGRAVRMRHKDSTSVDHSALSTALALAKEEDCEDVAILVRTRITKARIHRLAAKSRPPIDSRGVVQLSRAAEALRERDGRRAIELAQALVCRIVAGDDRPTEDELSALGIDASTLRSHVRKLLCDLVPARPKETWGAWSARAKEGCAAIADGYGIADHKARLGNAFKIGKKDKPDEIRERETPVALTVPDALATTVLTIHEAKGREFDGVLLYIAKPRTVEGASTCPAEAWWAPAAGSEEREVAFVAATRARRFLVVAVHEQSWAALLKKRASFVDLFEEALSAK